MSQRRMVSNRIVNSAKFLQMPMESQLLYFHLSLRTDDDGIVEAYPIIKLIGVSPDSVKVLLVKDYIRILNDDQVVVVVDFHEHNTIRKDRKIDSIYKHLLPEGIKTIEAKPRSDVKDNSKRLGGQSTDGISKDKIGKDKLSKDNKIVLVELPQSINGEAWEEWLEYRSSKKKPVSKFAARKQFALLEKYSESDQRLIIDNSIQNDWQGLFDLKSGSKNHYNNNKEIYVAE